MDDVDGAYDLSVSPLAGKYRIGFSSSQAGYVEEFWDDAPTVGARKAIVVAGSSTVLRQGRAALHRINVTGKVAGTGGAGLSGSA